MILGRFDNIHPGLTCDHARHILSLPIDELESQSDFYMAAAQLVNCPGLATEDALQSLLLSPLDDQAVKIAKRKGVEVLARLGSKSSIPSIGQCLWSDDIYLVENAVWALHQLGCNDQHLIQRMIHLLKDESQNQRVLIQALGKLAIEQSFELIQLLEASDQPGVRGAAIAAVANFTQDKSSLHRIKDHLTLPNQMDRQCAIQDLIDVGAVELLPAIASAPVSPAFRMRACHEILSRPNSSSKNVKALEIIDSILRDDPFAISIVHKYEESPGIEFLVRQLFSTDFSRCYLALQNLLNCSPEALFPVLQQFWEREAHNDYGAHYFFMHLFGLRDDWSVPDLDWMVNLLHQAVLNQRPQFQKSRAAAIQALHQLKPKLFFELGSQLIRGSIPSSWDCRYATVICMEKCSISGVDQIQTLLVEAHDDADAFVRARAAIALSTIC